MFTHTNETQNIIILIITTTNQNIIIQIKNIRYIFLYFINKKKMCTLNFFFISVFS